MTPAESLTVARDHAERAWYLFMRERNLDAKVIDWRTGVSPDGAPTLSVEVVGPGAANALARFARDYHLVLGQPGDQRPQFDITVPGRTVLVWRCSGTWVELWHPDTLPAAPPAPKPAGPVPAGRRPLLGPSGRLRFTRGRRTQGAA